MCSLNKLESYERIETIHLLKVLALASEIVHMSSKCKSLVQSLECVCQTS